MLGSSSSSLPRPLSLRPLAPAWGRLTAWRPGAALPGFSLTSGSSSTSSELSPCLRLDPTSWERCRPHCRWCARGSLCADDCTLHRPPPSSSSSPPLAALEDARHGEHAARSWTRCEYEYGPPHLHLPHRTRSLRW
jgi:hypothetical protein